MVARTLTSLALFCQRCGKLELHDLSRFSLNHERRQLYCHCGQWQGEIVAASHSQPLLRLPCLLCQQEHLLCFTPSQFWQVEMHRLYCPNHTLELGLIGRPDLLREQQLRHRQAWELLQREDDAEAIEDPQVLLEVLNMVHDLAAQGEISCACQQPQLEAEVLDRGVLLSCRSCGAKHLVPACNERDLTKAAQLREIELYSTSYAYFHS
nr:hypothetical protein [uncultured Anaeromusa sp.]